MGASNEELMGPNIVVTKRGPCLTREKQLELIHEISIEEIDAAIKDMPKDKSPGIDGYPIEFITTHWGLVKEEVYADMQLFFRNGKRMRTWNCTTITPVPKVPSPSYVKDFRPIACCTTLCKIVDKILTSRINRLNSN